MIRKLFYVTITALLIGLFFGSCIPQRRLSYFQDKDSTITNFPVDTTYLATIHSNDILTIFVASISEDASRYFNFSQVYDPLANNYIVDHFGNIQLPLVGNVHVGGMTTEEARVAVIKSLEKYLIKPSVRLNIQNFRVTILGEVVKPGVYPVQNEKITLTEALALAGDLTLFSVRENITIIRESNGKKEFGKVDITSRDFFASPYYNLHANDIIYVDAGQKRKQILTENYVRLITLLTTPIAAVYILYRVAAGK